MPDRYRRVLLFVAAGIVVLTLVAMIAVPFYISRASSDNRERLNDELIPLEFALGNADDFLLDVGLTAPQGEEEGVFGNYQESRRSLLLALDTASSHASVLDAEDEQRVTEAGRLARTYISDIADPVNEMTIAGDEEGAAAVQERAVEPFLAANEAIDGAVGVTRADITETLDENSDLEAVNTATTATLGALGLVSAGIIALLTLGLDRAHRREVEARSMAEIEKSRLDTIIDSIANGVAIFDANGLPVRVNEAGVRLWGISEEEIMNLRAAEVTQPNTLFDEAGREMGIEDLPSSIAMREDRQVADMLFTLRRDSGEQIDILASAAPLHDALGNVNGAVVVWHDITEIRSVERLKDEFLSFAAHELRTPLTIVKGYASVLARDTTDVGPRDMALTISEESDRISALINQLLDVSRMETGSLKLEIQPVRVAEIVDQVVARHRDVDPEREITIDFDSPDTSCVADPEALTQILDNLLSNARKYSEPGTPVEVRVQATGDMVEISVADHGIGIPPEEVERIGEKAFRGGNSKGREGSGLGLYIATKYLELQDGRIRVESELGEGSTFAILLPCAEPTSVQEEPSESSPVEA